MGGGSTGLFPSARRRAELRGAGDPRVLEQEDAEYSEAPA